LYALGHLAIGYLVAKILGKDSEVDIPLVLTASLIPDIDIIIPNIPHRGPTHSLMVAFILLLPVFYCWKTKLYTYYAAYASHIFADLLAGGVNGRGQILWPYSNQWINLYPKLRMGGEKEAIVEIILFAIALTILFITKDYKHLFKYRNTNFLLFFPGMVVLLSSLLGIYYGGSKMPSLFLLPNLLVSLLVLIVIVNNILKMNKPDNFYK
jgi:membrane-bound metal-dependent hydrolase YbcI (DUF457 family)